MRELIRFFRFFYRLRGNTVIYLLLVMMAAALFETMGVSIFLPILEGGSLDNPVGKVISSTFDLLRIEYSFTKMLLLMVILFTLRAAFLILKTSYVGKITSSLLVDLRTGTVRRLFETDYLYFLSKDAGYINNAVTVEFEHLAFALKMYTNVLLSIIFSIIYLALALALEPVLAVVILVLGGPAILVVRKINHTTKRYSVKTSNYSGRLQSILIQTLHHFKYLKSTFSQGNILRKIDCESKTLGDLHFKQTVLQAVSSEGFMPFIVLIIAGLLFYQVEVASVGTAQTVFFLLLLFRAISQILGVQQSYRKFLMSVGSINVYNALEHELRENNENLKHAGMLPDFDQSIVFKNVGFRYANGDYVLQDINCVIPPRSTVAFVGGSGTGKSTLVMLLTGILKPSNGEIFYGNIPYTNIDQKQLRRGIGYVTQESVIFNDTIRNNIRLWSQNDPDEKIESAAARAYINDFIERLPHGYDTLLGDNGMKISGGQRQRVSIARELFKGVKLLIFDEATSALDSDAEREIQKNIDELKGQKTVILIAHRLSTVKKSDIIFLLKDGRIVEQGSYDHLYRLNGEFRRMVDMQTTAPRQQEVPHRGMNTL